MKSISLTQDLFALVDDKDYWELSQFCWYALKSRSTFYAARTIRNSKGVRTTLLMHSALLSDARRVDHRDGNGLNNQRGNLRPASRIQNGQSHRQKHKGASSRYRGVSLNKNDGLWWANIRVSKKLIHLGRFLNEINAAQAYDDAARKYFGEFACPNFK